MGFEPMMRVLQTLALPLGDVAGENALRQQSYANHFVLSIASHAGYTAKVLVTLGRPRLFKAVTVQFTECG